MADDDPLQRYSATGVDAIDLQLPPYKAVVVVFDPADPPEVHEVFSAAAAADIVPLLRAVVARLESGALRMPVDGGVRWIDVVVEGDDGGGRR